MGKITPLDIIEYLNHDCETEKAQSVQEWINENPENKTEYYRLKQLWALKTTQKHSSKAEVDAAVHRFNNEVAGRNKIHRLRRIIWATSSIAAVLAIILTTIGIEKYSERFEWHTISNNSRNEVMYFTLDDGTKVSLNHGSELSYRHNFDSRNRNVRLEGEAFFDVTSDPVHPFTVHTSAVKVRVLGTQFNVKTGETFVAVLESGCIELEDASGHRLTTMRPGQLAMIDTDSGCLTSLQQVNTRKYTDWRFNQNVYENISFREIISLLEDRYDVSVIYDPSSFSDASYRLVINDNETLEQMLEMLKIILPIEYNVTDDRVFIKCRKQ